MDKNEVEVLVENVEEWQEEVKVFYKVEEIPPIGVSILLGFQHFISMCVATLTIPILLAPSLCMFEDNVGKSEMTGTLFVASGIITLIQTFFGIRLPIVQAGTFALLVPTLSYFSLPQWECPSNIVMPEELNLTQPDYNSSFILMGSGEHREIWMLRLRDIQGCIMLAAIFEVIMGLSGLVGLMMKFIGPLTICPTVTLLGLSLFKSAPTLASKDWSIAIATIFLIVLFSQYLDKVNVPLFIRTNGKCMKKNFPLFKMFPIILGVSITWLICYIVTVSGWFPDHPSMVGYHGRTDLRSRSIDAAPWFRVPYPGQWGMPTATLAGVLVILSGIIATIIESVGDYYSCAKLSGAPPPPMHAINRGILVEGLGSLLDGIMGTGNGTTSTSINVGVIGITRVGSRAVVQISAILMIVAGLFTKFGALFLSIPDPIIGGSFFILFAMIVAVGISSLQHVDMNSSRNLFIIGISILMGLSIPEWLSSNPDAIKTGNVTADGIVSALLRTGMFVGGVLGFFFDNTIRGSRRERGLEYWDKLRLASQNSKNTKLSSHLVKRLSATYDLPFFSDWIKKIHPLQYIPLCPTYRGCAGFRSSRSSTMTVDVANGVSNDADACTKL